MRQTDERSAAEWLNDIVAWNGMLQRHIAGMDFTAFERDLKTQHAVSKCVEVLGEASSRLLKDHAELLRRFPDFEARSAYAARNRLSHGYYGVSLPILWNAATISAPEFAARAKAILDTLEPGSADA